MADDRRAVLETQVAYLEKTVDDLNDVVIGLQARCDALERKLDRLISRLEMDVAAED